MWTIVSQNTEILHQLLDGDPAARTASDALTEAGGRVFIVGGAVRDAVLGAQPKDIDLMCAGLTDEQIEAALAPLGKLDFTGKAFGVFRFKKGDSEVEIALPRTERSTGTGHKDFEVMADPFLSPEEDLGRRDFTGNAMAYDIGEKSLLDPYGGADDLRAGKLRLVNENAFVDDPLRIVRALVAQARFGLEPEPELVDSMRANAHRIRHLPGERIQMELDKLLAGRDPVKAMSIAADAGLLDYMIPELSSAVGFDQQNPHHDLNVYDHTMQVLSKMAEISNDPDLRLAALFHDSGKPDSFWRDETKPPGSGGHFYKKINEDGTELGGDHEEIGAELVEQFMNRLRYPTKRIERVKKLVAHHMFPYFTNAKGARKFLNKMGGDVGMAFDLLKLREADASGKTTGEMSAYDARMLEKNKTLLQEVIDNNSAATVKDLAINGKDLIELGMKPGPEIGKLLSQILDMVIENPELNTREDLLQIVENGLR
jgi:tRNA nucleotidyltransferase (CCA-adding enzyme)